jgi:glycosyl transferase family 25
MIDSDQMKIFVINLPQDTERLRQIDQQLKTLGLDYELFPGIIGKELSEDELKRHLDGKWFYRYQGRHALPGDVGCSLSHIGVYREIVKRNLKHALVLEDDAWLNPNLPELLQAISGQYRHDIKEVILLTWFKSIEQKRRENLWAHYHAATAKSAFCAHGYVISNAGAKTLIDHLYPVKHVADCWNWLMRHRVLNVKVVFPTCITVDMSYEVRTTPELGNADEMRPLPKKFTRKLYRAFWNYIDLLTARLSRLHVWR